MNAWPGIFLVLAVLGGALGLLARLGGRARLGAELQRKLVHMLLGLVCAAFPWIFENDWPVFFLAGLAVAGLAALRWLGRPNDPARRVLHGVERADSSWGELCFPVAIALCWATTPGRWQYVAAVLVLALADAAGALAGTRFGRKKLVTDEGAKSLEGCTAVFVVALACVIAPLRAGGVIPGGWVCLVLVSLQVALLATLFELAALRGLDNFILPLATLGLIERYTDFPAGALAVRVAVLAVLLIGGIIWRRRTRLNHAGMACAALAFFLFWVLGGWRHLFPALAGGAIYAGLCVVGRPRQNAGGGGDGMARQVTREVVVRHDFGAVLAALGAPLGWVLLSARLSFSPGIAAAGFISMIATQVALMAVATWSGAAGECRGSGAKPKAVPLSLATGGAFMLGGMFFLERSLGGTDGVALPMSFQAGAWVGFFVAVPVFAAARKYWGRNPDGSGRWILQGLLPLTPLALVLIAGVLFFPTA
jgi:phytol kinase